MIKDGKAYRFTFSKSLAEYLCRWSGPEALKYERMEFRVGKRLQHGERSASGLYAIMSTKTKDDDLALRITMSPDIAAMMTQDHWRDIRECWLLSKVGHAE